MDGAPVRRSRLLATSVAVFSLLLVPETSLSGQEPLSWDQMQEQMGARMAADEPLRISYGPASEQFGVLRLPRGPGPFPVAVIIHGGCWLSIADHRYLEPLAVGLNEAGWATWSLEFRRIDMAGGAWPGILRDVAAGMDYLRTVAAREPLDLDRVVALGHSSGGHLALWAALRSGLDEAGAREDGLWSDAPLPLRGAAGLAPIADLDDYRGYSRCGSTIVTDFLAADGVAGEEERRQSLSDPARLVPSAVPQLILLGELDEVVPPAHGRAYLERAAAAGQDVELRVVPGAGHFELVAPWTPAWRDVAPVLLGWMKERAGGS